MVRGTDPAENQLRKLLIMRTLKTMRQITLGVTLLVASATSTLCSDDPYTVFLDSRDSEPGVYTGFWDIAAGPSGQVYSVGFIEDGDTLIDKAVIRSLDRGAPGTWEVSTALTDGGRTFFHATVDGFGNLYAMAGYGGDEELWRSTEEGVNMQWLTTLKQVLPTGYQLAWRALAADAAGNVFVAGYRPVTTGRTTLNRWIVARGIPTSSGGLAWSVVDEFALDATYGSYATGLAIRPSNHPSIPSEVWVRGTVGSKSGNQVALRRSTNGGTAGSWQTVTTYAGDTRWFRGIGADSLAVGVNGEVYDVGQVAVSLSKKTVENRWNTWRLAPGAASVQVVDQLPVASSAFKVAVDSTGRVYVHGGRFGFDGSVLRTSPNGNSGTWDDYDLAENASFYGMTLDDEGSLYLAGELCEPDACLGYIRKLPSP
jgi:hypothetical protein